MSSSDSVVAPLAAMSAESMTVTEAPVGSAGGPVTITGAPTGAVGVWAWAPSRGSRPSDATASSTRWRSRMGADLGCARRDGREVQLTRRAQILFRHGAAPIVALRLGRRND